jgi:hypothetical protein
MGLVLARIGPIRRICFWQRHTDEPASSSSARYLGDQGDMEIRWSPAPHFIAAINLAGFQPGGFFDHVVNNHPPIAANAGLTFRF